MQLDDECRRLELLCRVEKGFDNKAVKSQITRLQQSLQKTLDAKQKQETDFKQEIRSLKWLITESGNRVKLLEQRHKEKTNEVKLAHLKIKELKRQIPIQMKTFQYGHSQLTHLQQSKQTLRLKRDLSDYRPRESAKSS